MDTITREEAARLRREGYEAGFKIGRSVGYTEGLLLSMEQALAWVKRKEQVDEMSVVRQLPDQGPGDASP